MQIQNNDDSSKKEGDLKNKNLLWHEILPD